MSLTGKPALTTSAALANDGFWPDVALGDLLSKYRVPAEYADETIKTGVMLSMVRVNKKLAKVETAIIALGYVTLQAYCDANIQQIAGEDVLILQYRHAVFCRAKAFLLRQFPTVNRRPVAENEAKEAPETEQYWLDQSQAAIASFFELFLPDEAVAAQDGVYVALL
ncbi:MAG: head completion/stabilization protein [Methylomicrobium sp.]